MKAKYKYFETSNRIKVSGVRKIIATENVSPNFHLKLHQPKTLNFCFLHQDCINEAISPSSLRTPRYRTRQTEVSQQLESNLRLLV